MWMVCLVVAGTAVAAQPREGLFARDKGGEPWAQGVSEGAQQKANALFGDGIAAVKAANYPRAADRFIEALAFWNHPKIHFDLAKTYMNLGSSTRALEHFWASMRYSGGALELSEIDLVARYSRLIYSQEVSHLVVRLEDDAVVELGGAVVLSKPGTWQGLVAVGAQALIVKRRGVEVARLDELCPAGTRVEVLMRPAPGGRVSASTTRRTATDTDARELQTALVGFQVVWPSALASSPSDIRLPPKYAAICDHARGDLAYVCKEYERLFRATELNKLEALKRLEALTKGGVVEALE